MPHYCFVCPQGSEVAGCVERVCCETPFMAPRVHPQTRQPMVDQQTGRPLMGPDARATWNWLMQSGYPFPPGIAFQCIITNPSYNPATRAPNVYCIQQTEPQVARAPVNAPYNAPQGNRGAPPAPPPMSGQQRAVPAGMYEDLGAGLAGTSDPMIGEIDGEGGTYMDIDAQGNETQRSMSRQAGPPVAQQRQGG